MSGWSTSSLCFSVLSFYCIYLSIFFLILFCSIFLVSQWNAFKRKTINSFVELRADCYSKKLSYSIHAATFCFFAILFYRLFYRTIIWHNGDMYIGLANNYGDLPLHFSYITSFVWGDNIPPQNPLYAGEVLSYPILSDFLSAVFLKLGLSFRNILLVPGFLLTTCFYCILYYFVYRLTKNRVGSSCCNIYLLFLRWFWFLPFYTRRF